jgi:mannose-1-phosphate guanylyltransferase
VPLVTPEVHRKVWGRELWIANSDLYCAKRLVIDAGWQCSLHYHKIKDEIFTVTKGAVTISLGGERLHLRVGDSVHVRPWVKHRFAAEVDSELFEVSTRHSDEDVYRIEPSGRMQ